jgi:hypothetical protein
VAAQEATKALMTTVKSLPELRAQKRKLDNHMNLLYALLNAIKARTLDKYHDVGQNILSGASLRAGRLSSRLHIRITAIDPSAAICLLALALKCCEAVDVVLVCHTPPFCGFRCCVSSNAST